MLLSHHLFFGGLNINASPLISHYFSGGAFFGETSGCVDLVVDMGFKF